MSHAEKVTRVLWIKRQLRSLFRGYRDCPRQLLETLNPETLDGILRDHEADFRDAERFRVRRGGRPRGRPSKAVVA